MAIVVGEANPIVADDSQRTILPVWPANVNVPEVKPSQIVVPPLTAPPTVDGSTEGLKSNFMFAFNQSSPLCCPSTYTTSSGCVCLSQKQKDFISNRGTIYNK